MKKTFVAAVAALAFTSPLMAQPNNPGVSGGESSDSLTVTATIDEMVKVSGLDDLLLTIDAASVNGPSSHAAIELDNFCVYSNVGTQGAYNIRVDGNAGSANQRFALSGANGSVDYIVHLQGVDTTNPNGDVVSAGQTRNYTTASGTTPRATDATCSNVGGENATLSARITDAAALAAVAGTYTGTLTVVVSVP